jgi:hypothetical protein
MIKNLANTYCFFIRAGHALRFAGSSVLIGFLTCVAYEPIPVL